MMSKKSSILIEGGIKMFKNFEEAKKAGYKGTAKDFEKDLNDTLRILKDQEKIRKSDTFDNRLEGTLNKMLMMFYLNLTCQDHKGYYQIFEYLFDFMILENINIKNKKQYQEYILDIRCKEVEKNANSNINRSANFGPDFRE
jgi:hypothetical protein